MSNRVTRANLDALTDALTDVFRDADIITDRERVVLYGAYGGWRYDVTGATVEDGTGHREGIAGLAYGCNPARYAWENGWTVVKSIRATLDANRDALNVGRGL